MENFSKLKETLNEHLNNAFSINYMVLDNINHILPENGNMVFTRDDIFGSKSKEKRIYNERFHEYAKMRTESFLKIREGLESYGFQEKFKRNSKVFVEIYNELGREKVKYDDIFSDDDIKDWNFFYEVDRILRKGAFRSNKERFELAIINEQFLGFYDEYRAWKSAYDIFNVLSNDINDYGNKSIHYGRTGGKNVLKIKKDDYEKFFNGVFRVLDRTSAMLNEEYRKTVKLFTSKQEFKKDDRLSELEYLLSVIQLIENYYQKMEKRYEAANKPYKQQDNRFKIFKKLFTSNKKENDENKLVVDSVYVHKLEIQELVDLLLAFPELKKFADKADKLILPEGSGFGDNAFASGKM